MINNKAKPYGAVASVVRSNLRRYMQLGAIDTANKADIIEIGGLELDTQAKSLKVDGELCQALPPRSLKFLSFLHEKRRQDIFCRGDLF